MKKLVKLFVALLFCVLTALPVLAQNGSVKCIVSDNAGPMPGASVLVKGTTNGGITDVNGSVTLGNVPGNATLVVSFVGYETVEVPVTGKSLIRVTLKDDSTLLNETVVVGYGTQKKANLTGAVDQVGEEVFEGRPNANLAQMLQGRVANLNLKFTDGRPNSSPSFNIRGRTSIGQGGSALVLIDGVEGNASLLNPNDIESVSVLKDAASSAIYGSRAPYGVVLITTKNAKKGTATVSYQANFSFETPTAMPDVVSDGYTWAEHFYKSWYNYKGNNPTAINKTMEFSTAWLEEYRQRAETGNFETLVSDGSIGTKGRWLYYHKGTDYYDYLYKDFTFTQTHNISVSGADDKFDYYVSARIYDNNGLFGNINNAIVKNFRISGSLTSDGYTYNGVIGQAEGNSVISGIYSDMSINVSNKNAHSGGIVGGMTTGSKMEIHNCEYAGTFTHSGQGDCQAGICGYTYGGGIFNCVFSGTIIGQSSKYGGILGYCKVPGFKGVQNCLCVGKIIANEGCTTAAAIIANWNGANTTAVKNNYYRFQPGSTTTIAIGNKTSSCEAPTEVTEKQLMSGEVCYKLNGSQSVINWYQNINEDSYPVPFENHEQVFFDEEGSFYYNLINGIPVGINEVKSEEPKVETVMTGIFNLAGQRLEKLQKGINIVNGKKVLVK